MSNAEKDILQIIKSKVTNLDSLSTVMLFGSRAKGNYKEESDWDILILVNNQTIVAQIKEEILNIEIEFEICIHALIFEVIDWEEKAVMPIYKSIKEEGIVI
jgi:uncharacterized protein